MTRVKICGLMRPEDADAVNAAGADCAGFILSAGFRRSVDAGLAARIAGRLVPDVVPVGVFVDEPPERIACIVAAGTVRAVQLHGGEDGAYIEALRALLPAGVPIAQAFKVTGPADVAAANESKADLVLLDAGQGTGRTFDWTNVAGVSRPYVLAGGLGPDNVARAVVQLGPFAVDMSSGVETGGVKDPEKIAHAVRAVRRADAAAGHDEATIQE